MSGLGKRTVEEVARRRRIDVAGIMGPSRSSWYVAARVEIARLLDVAGMMPTVIGRVLNRDHTTVLYYLGRLEKKPRPEKIEPPMVVKPLLSTDREIIKRLIKTPVIKVPVVVKPKKYLTPYAGADKLDYRWRERHRG